MNADDLDELREVERRWRQIRRAFEQANVELHRLREQARVESMTPAERRRQLRVVVGGAR